MKIRVNITLKRQSKQPNKYKNISFVKKKADTDNECRTRDQRRRNYTTNLTTILRFDRITPIYIG